MEFMSTITVYKTPNTIDDSPYNKKKWALAIITIYKTLSTLDITNKEYLFLDDYIMRL